MNNNASISSTFDITASRGGALPETAHVNTRKSPHSSFFVAFLYAILITLTISPVAGLANHRDSSARTDALPRSFEPEVVVNKSWIEYNVTEKGRKGMRVHVDLEITGLKGIDVKLVTRVTDSDDNYLMSQTAYSNSEGEFEASFSMKPGFETSVYDDATMFVPYSELKTKRPKMSLRVDVDLNYEDGELIKHLVFKPFVFNSSGSAEGVEEKPEVTAELTDVWVEQNVVENRRKGMRIHVHFDVTGLKGVASRLTARVKKSNDEFLMSSTSFANDNGELEASFDMKPGYPTTEYEDAQIFLPYDEMVLRKGLWDLVLDIDLNYDNGDLIQHLALHEFQYQR